MGSDIIIHAQNNIIYKFMAQKAFIGSEIITNDSCNEIHQKKVFLLGFQKIIIMLYKMLLIQIFYPKENKLKKIYNLNTDDILLFSPRALEPVYNIDIIFGAIKILKDANLSLKCMFTYAFGDEYSAKLRKIAKDLNIENNIIWLGFKSYKEMAELYNASDIVVQSQVQIVSPKSVYEAMFLQKPVIVSDLEWSNEFFEQDKNIFKIKNISSHEVSYIIKNIISNLVRLNLSLKPLIELLRINLITDQTCSI